MACVDETPQKIVESKLTSFLCGCTLKKERVCIFGKSSVDIQGLIKAAIDVDVTVFSSSEIFICTANCYRRLIRFEKISNNLCTLKKEIKKDYDNGGSGVRTKRLRKETTCLEAQMDPRTSVISLSELAPSIGTSAAKSLKFPGPATCTSELAPSVENSAAKSLKFPGPTTCTSYFAPADPAHGLAFVAEESRENVSFFASPPPPSLFLTSTPVAKDNAPFKSSNAATFTSVDVTIKYPSKTVNRTLAKDYETIAKALTFGPPQRLAKAVLKCKLLSKHVNLLSESGLCSRKTPSLLRKCGKEDLENFKFQSLCDEWRERSPLFFSFLMTCCISGRSRDQAVKWLPSAVVAGSVLLKQRNQEMNATASVLGVLLKTGSIEEFLYKMCFHFFLVTKNSLLSFIVIKF